MSGRVLVTGGLGFIGSAFVRALAAAGEPVLNADLDTYAGDERRIDGVPAALVETVRLDVASPELAELVRAERPSLIVHFAAESHVTRSEDAPEVFFHANVAGTRAVLDAAATVGACRVVHMSTDEVYGPCPADPFREDEKLPGEGLATSAYARSKGLADDLALSYAGRVDVVVARPTNCIGPWQHPEKAVPRWATRALRGERLPVWGDGGQVRDWMFVDDAVSALRVLAERGERGQVYNVGPPGRGRAQRRDRPGRCARRGAGRELRLPEPLRPAPARPPLRRRDTTGSRALGWRTSRSLEAAIAETVEWYRRERGVVVDARPRRREALCRLRRRARSSVSASSRLDVYGDLRGRFSEIFRVASMPETFVQCNHSHSAPGVLRGLHYHQHQADLWYVPAGRAQVGLVDLRRPGRNAPRVARPRRGRADHRLHPAGRGARLSRPHRPRCHLLGHGRDDPSDEHGVAWNDPTLAIPWQLDAEPVVSERDAQNPGLDWDLVPTFS